MTYLLILLMALPSIITDEFLPTGTASEVDASGLGRVTIDAGDEVLIERDDLAVDFTGTIFTPTNAVQNPFTVTGGLASTATFPSRRIGSGVITADTDELTLLSTSGINVGDKLLIRLGVQIYDSQEPVYMVYRTVAAINGLVVRLTQAFGFECPVYASAQAMIDLGADPLKMGDWGINGSGYFARGLGTSHDVFIFPNGRPYRNVTVNGLGVEWAADSLAYGSTAFLAFTSDNCKFRCCYVTNPTGNCYHGWWPSASGVEGFRTYGIGRSTPFGEGSGNYPANAIAMWGGENCYAKRLLIKSTNTTLLNVEAGSVNTLIDHCFLETGALTGSAQHFGIFSTNHGFRVHNTCLKIPTASSSTFPTALADVEFRNTYCHNEAVPDYLRLSFNWGRIRFGSRKFGPLTSLDMQFTTSGSPYTVPRPDGLYRSASIVLTSRNHISEINAPSNLFTAQPGSLTISFDDEDRWGRATIGAIDDYYAELLATVVTDGTPVSGRFVAEYHPEIV
jgi:hypothetical protein